MNMSLGKYRWRMLLLGLIYGYFTSYFFFYFFEDKLDTLPLVLLSVSSVIIVCVLTIFGPKSTVSYYLKDGVVPDVERELERLGYSYSTSKGTKRYYFKQVGYLIIHMASIRQDDDGLKLKLREPYDNIFLAYCIRYAKGFGFHR